MVDHRHAGLSEVGSLLGVSRQRALQLIDAYPDFPKPADTLHMGKVWHVHEITAWAQRHPRKPGRPPKQGA